jgi:alpha-glucosidase
VSTLFWLGDQLQTWDDYDGIKSAVVGLQSGGVSGFSLLHSDTGGYNAFSITHGGKKVPAIARSPELLMRWMELSAFTAVLRTHEGLDPSISAQFDTNAETLAQLKRCAGIYAALAFYRTELVAEASRTGHPIVRHPFLQYPDDKNTYGLRYQFLYGSELMFGPVLDKGANSVRLYLPAGVWTNVWTGQTTESTGAWFTGPAPLGKPAVFYRAGSPVGARFLQELKARNIN